jgi:uncharacterized repeat protein (TIGR01451 family)
MSRTFAISLLAFLLVFIGLAIEAPHILVLALPLVMYLLMGLWRSPEKVQLEASRALSAERVLLDEQVMVTLTVKNNGPSLEEVLLEDVLPEQLEVVEGSNRRLVSLPAGGLVTWTYSLIGKRGYYMLHEVRATSTEYFGLGSVSSSLETDGQLFVLPPVLRLRRVSIRPRRTRVYSGTIPARQGGPGVEFFDVRDYQVGDSPRSINWRVTARHPQGIYSNQYEQERVVDVGIILDGRRRTNEFGSRSIFEHSVMATAALADALLSSGNRVGLLFYGKQIHWTMPGYGKVQGERILHDLSRLEPGESQAFTELYIPRRLFPTHSQLVLVSPLIPDDFRSLSDLRSKGYSVLVISPDPVTFEESSLPQTRAVELARRVTHLKREVFLRRLRGIGVHVVNWDVSLPFEQVARRELERRQPVMRGGR